MHDFLDIIDSMVQCGPKGLQLKVLWCFFFPPSLLKLHYLCMLGCARFSWHNLGRYGMAGREPCITREVRFMQKNSETANGSAVSPHWMQYGLWGFFSVAAAQHNTHARTHARCPSKHTQSTFVKLKATGSSLRVYIHLALKQREFLKTLKQKP